MMSRIWRGWTTLANADTCARSQHYEVRAEMKSGDENLVAGREIADERRKKPAAGQGRPR